MFSIGYVMKVKPEKYDGYKEAHDNLWPEIARSMSDNHVSMSIFRFENLLFLHAVAPTEEDWEKSRQHPELPRWATYMEDFLEQDGHGNVFFPQLPETFAFGTFEQGTAETG